MHTNSAVLFNENTSFTYVDVIVPLYLKNTLTWFVPSQFHNGIAVGVRVEVQIGKSRRYAGIIKKIHQDKPANIEVKPILNVLDDRPILHEDQLKLWAWISKYYMCTEGEVMIAALPSHLKLSSETVVVFNPDHEVDTQTLNEKEYLVSEALEIRSELKISEIQKILDSNHVYPVIKQLIDKRICLVFEQMNETYKAKTETYIHLNSIYHNEEVLETLVNSWSKAPKQLDLLLSFLHLQRTQGDVLKSALLKKANASPAVFDGLVAKDILKVEKRQVDRLPNLPKEFNINFRLSVAQETALMQIQESFQQFPATLLHGVTGSGKTMVYIKLLEQFIKKGVQSLFLLPEIALTSQIIRKLRDHLGGHVAIYHSKFNMSERLELWHKVKSGEVKVVLGARSALFLPFSKLEFIIIDEEHDASYKQQDPAPRYNARDAAIFYAGLVNAKVLLGSATPSLETYYNATTHKYGLVKLSERFGNLELPDITTIDLKLEALDAGQSQIFAPLTIDSIRATLDKGRQIIIFQNRRGYSPYIICNTCSWIPKCTNCDVSLNYHKSSNKLHCHYCGSTYPLYKTCGNCGNQDLLQKNFGTEHIEENLETVFPEQKVARMDTDSIKGKHSHDTLIKQFEEHKIDLLVGTQMVVKGLDFDNVGAVVIPDGDSILHFNDFRVNERAFQLIEQVSGRAGRKNEHGQVFIQLRDTNHPLIEKLQKHDYDAFYNTEIQERQMFFYPPFSRIINVQSRHNDAFASKEAMTIFCNFIRQQYPQFVFGPAQPVINKVRNQYIFECMLKFQKNRQIIDGIKSAIETAVVEVLNHPHLKRTIFTVDVDPL
ncbi:replication restart helicase PriA [Polluticaenibacter yanchengensis]|uniref:Replication restart protein PriA n=1 Tax=Polluticaenibacter yanchengensis TaxID=3014562 RepID=A0ABT4UM83_9BACT|nr:primosomal protein N' [Chitinophagaceae bacterium LY-5]